MQTNLKKTLHKITMDKHYANKVLPWTLLNRQTKFYHGYLQVVEGELLLEPVVRLVLLAGVQIQVQFLGKGSAVQGQAGRGCRGQRKNEGGGAGGAVSWLPARPHRSRHAWVRPGNKK